MSNKTVATELAETSKQLTEALETNANLGQEVISLRDQLSTANTAVEASKTELARVTGELEAKEKAIIAAAAEATQLKADIETAKKSASAKAADIVASQGCPAVEGLNVPTPPSAAELMAQFQRISDPKAKTEFYRKHQSVIDPR